MLLSFLIIKHCVLIKLLTLWLSYSLGCHFIIFIPYMCSVHAKFMLTLTCHRWTAFRQITDMLLVPTFELPIPFVSSFLCTFHNILQQNIKLQKPHIISFLFSKLMNFLIFWCYLIFRSKIINFSTMRQISIVNNYLSFFLWNTINKKRMDLHRQT